MVWPALSRQPRVGARATLRLLGEPRVRLALLTIAGTEAARRSAGSARVLVSAVTVTGGYELLRRLVRQRRAAQTSDFRELCRQLLIAVFVELPDDDEFDRTSIGLHVFTVQNPVGFGQPYLGPVARFRLGARPPSSGVAWRQGVGAVGECWRRAEPVAVEFAEERASAEEWAAEPEARLGLSYEEYLRLSDYYGAVVAFPVIFDGLVQAVLAIDGPPGAKVDRLTDEQVLGPLGQAASILADVLQAQPGALYPGPGLLEGVAVTLRALTHPTRQD